MEPIAAPGEWLDFSGLPSVLLIAAGIVCVFFLPSLIHRQATRQENGPKQYLIHFGALALTALGVACLVWGLLHYTDGPEDFSTASDPVYFSDN